MNIPIPRLLFVKKKKILSDAEEYEPKLLTLFIPHTQGHIS